MNASQLLVLAGLLRGADPPKPDDAADPVRTKAQAYLKKADAERAIVQIVRDDSLAKLFPKHQFATAMFRQHPLAVVPAKGMKPSNVLALPEDGDPILITDPD